MAEGQYICVDMEIIFNIYFSVIKLWVSILTFPITRYFTKTYLWDINTGSLCLRPSTSVISGCLTVSYLRQTLTKLWQTHSKYLCQTMKKICFIRREGDKIIHLTSKLYYFCSSEGQYRKHTPPSPARRKLLNKDICFLPTFPQIGLKNYMLFVCKHLSFSIFFFFLTS